MVKRKKKRTDDDYVRLDNAICAMLDWEPEIEEALNRAGCSEILFRRVIDAMRQVHSPDEE